MDVLATPIGPENGSDGAGRSSPSPMRSELSK
jgi:hypothetical protein